MTFHWGLVFTDVIKFSAVMGVKMFVGNLCHTVAMWRTYFPNFGSANDLDGWGVGQDVGGVAVGEAFDSNDFTG